MRGAAPGWLTPTCHEVVALSYPERILAISLVKYLHETKGGRRRGGGVVIISKNM